MRQILFAAALSAAVIASVRAQTPTPEWTRVTVRYSKPDRIVHLGGGDWYNATFFEKYTEEVAGNGTISLPANIFQGLTTIPVVEVRCKAEPDRRRLLLPFSREQLDDLEKKLLGSSVCAGDCTCKPLKPMRFKEDYTYSWAPPFYARPEYIVPIAGGAAGGTILLAKSGSDGEGTPDNPGQPPAVNLLGIYDFNGIVQQRGACNFVDFRSIVEFSGTASNFSARLAETGGTFPFTGTATITPDRIQFNTSANVTIAGLGNAVATFVGQILSNRTATATQTMNFSCGTVTVAQTGTKR